MVNWANYNKRLCPNCSGPLAIYPEVVQCGRCNFSATRHVFDRVTDRAVVEHVHQPNKYGDCDLCGYHIGE